MEIDYDIYENLSKNDINTYDEIEKLQEQNNQQRELIESLQDDINRLCAKIVDMKQTQDNLTRNISELYKTARAEIDRKDRTIVDLRSQVEKIKLEKKTHNTKRERSPYLHRSSFNSGEKRFKEDYQFERSQSVHGRSSGDKYKISYNNSNRDRRRMESNDRYDYKHRSIREHNYKKTSSSDRKRDVGNIVQEEYKKEKCCTQKEKNDKQTPISRNEVVGKEVNEKFGQENNRQSESAFDNSTNRVNIMNEKLEKKVENDLRQSTVIEEFEKRHSAMIADNINKKKLKGRCNGDFKRTEIEKNEPKIDVTIKLEQKQFHTSKNESDYVNEKQINKTFFQSVTRVIFSEKKSTKEVQNISRDMQEKNTHTETEEAQDSEDIKNGTSDDAEKEKGLPSTKRILRSATRRNSYREKIVINNKVSQEITPPKQLLLTVFPKEMCLTHEGEIPVLHISDSEPSPCDRFDISLCSVTPNDERIVNGETLSKDGNSYLNQCTDENVSNNDNNNQSMRKRKKYFVTLIDP